MGIDGPGGGAEPKGEWIPLLAVVDVSHKIGKIRRHFGNVRQGAASRIDWGHRGER